MFDRLTYTVSFDKKNSPRERPYNIWQVQNGTWDLLFDEDKPLEFHTTDKTFEAGAAAKAHTYIADPKNNLQIFGDMSLKNSPTEGMVLVRPAPLHVHPQNSFNQSHDQIMNMFQEYGIELNEKFLLSEYIYNIYSCSTPLEQSHLYMESIYILGSIFEKNNLMPDEVLLNKIIKILFCSESYWSQKIILELYRKIK